MTPSSNHAQSTHRHQQPRGGRDLRHVEVDRESFVGADLDQLESQALVRGQRSPGIGHRAGSAGSGVVLTMRNAMTKRYGLSKEEAASRFYILDEHGLVTKARHNLSEMEELFHDLSILAADETDMEGLGLLDVIKAVKPTGLIGN